MDEVFDTLLPDRFGQQEFSYQITSRQDFGILKKFAKLYTYS
jgi:hypothetical protein